MEWLTKSQNSVINPAPLFWKTNFWIAVSSNNKIEMLSRKFRRACRWFPATQPRFAALRKRRPPATGHAPFHFEKDLLGPPDLPRF
jgi:hypothetical protein